MESSVGNDHIEEPTGAGQAQDRAPAVRRGSIKERYDELIEERKKMDQEKVNHIKEIRQQRSSGTSSGGSIKNKWEGVVAQHKDHEIKKYEEFKETTMLNFRGDGTSTHNVQYLIKKFNRIFLQKRLKNEQLISRYAKMKEKVMTMTTINSLNIENCPELITGVLQFIDLSVITTKDSSSSLIDDIRKELAENSIIYPEVGLFSEGDHRPPIEVSSLICLTETGDLVLSLRMDVLPSHTNDLKSYGHQKVIFYLPSSSDLQQDPAGEHKMGPEILQFEFDLCPSVGWEEFHRRTELMNSFDPVDIMKTHNSFFIQPIGVKKQAPPPPPPAPIDQTSAANPLVEVPFPDSPCGSEPILLHTESLETASTTETDISQQQPTLDDSQIQIVLDDSQEDQDHDGYLILPGDYSTNEESTSSALSDGTLPIVTSYVPSILYHESHEHRLIPTSVLDPNLDLTPYSCISCSKSATTLTSPLLFVCPECKSFLCTECSQSGNGVKGSIDTKQIELNAEILFKPGYSSLLPESYNLLDQIGKFLLENPIPIRIEGHINAVQETGRLLDDSSKLLSVREPNCNGQMLSHRRAEKVSQYLQSLGIPASLLKVEGCGGRRPITREKKLLNKNRYGFLLQLPPHSLLCS